MGRIRGVRVLLIVFATLVVVASIGFAYQSLDARLSPALHAPAPAPEDHSRHLPALLPEEESYAASLWAIHSAVKLAAVRMSFAGIDYKTDHHDEARFRAAIQPLLGEFEQARKGAAALPVPGSMTSLHDRYLGAIALYRTAAGQMLEGTADGSDASLLAAQDLSFRASEETLRVGDQLWPTEHKPH